MRTKSLFLAAALAVAGLSSALAQVYSVNVVGYVNTTLQPGYNLIANPLETADNAVEDLFSAPLDGMAVFKYTGGSYQIANYSELLGGWDNSFTLDPGEGAFVFLPGTTPSTVTFVGEITAGQKSVSLPANFSMVSSAIPQAGGLVTDLEFPVADGDAVYQYDPASGYSINNYSELLGGWDTGAEPEIGVGEAFFVFKAAAATWNRTFTVGN